MIDNLILIETTATPFWTKVEKDRIIHNEFTHEGFLRIEFKGRL